MVRARATPRSARFVEPLPWPWERASADPSAARDGRWVRYHHDTDAVLKVSGPDGIEFTVGLVTAAERAIELNTPPILPPARTSSRLSTPGWRSPSTSAGVEGALSAAHALARDGL